jgi:hypothetical protein
MSIPLEKHSHTLHNWGPGGVEGLNSNLTGSECNPVSHVCEDFVLRDWNFHLCQHWNHSNVRNSICALQVVKDVFSYHSDNYLNVRGTICCVVGFTSKMGSVPLVMIRCDIYCNWVSTQCQWLVNLYKNSKETAIYKMRNITHNNTTQNAQNRRQTLKNV